MIYIYIYTYIYILIYLRDDPTSCLPTQMVSRRHWNGGEDSEKISPKWPFLAVLSNQ